MWHDRLKTGLIVVLLTGLIWFFADQADTASKTITLRLAVQPPSSAYLVMAQEPEALQFEVTFSASRAVIDEMDKQLQTKPLNPTFVMGKPEKDAKRARQTFESIKVLSQLDAIRRPGLTITSVRPEMFTVEIDSMVRRPMRIKPEFGEMVVDAGDPKPVSVEVILPSTMADELSGDTLAVDVTRYVDASKPNELQHPTVELQWSQSGPKAKLVRFEPASFDIRFKLKDTTAPRTFRSVPVSFSATYEVLSRYTPVPLDKAEFLPDITVAGPRQLVENLRKEDIQLVVQVYGSDEANIGQPISRQIKIQSLPASVQVITQLRDVRFTLQEKNATAGLDAHR